MSQPFYSERRFMLRTEDIIDEITQWIDSNLHKPLKIEDVAARAGYSRWHLQRIFFQVKGENIAAYIREKKLSLAAKDLIKSNDRVLEISFRYGFGENYQVAVTYPDDEEFELLSDPYVFQHVVEAISPL